MMEILDSIHVLRKTLSSKYLLQDSAPYALRSCLGKEPLSVVRSIDDNIEKMLKRLDEKYWDPAKIADVVI